MITSFGMEQNQRKLWHLKKTPKFSNFPKERSFKPKDFEPSEPQNLLKEAEIHRPSEQEEPNEFYSSEMLLYQREMTKERESKEARREAANGYERATDIYIVKSKDLEGKTQIKFASTNGVLVNKKQA